MTDDPLDHIIRPPLPWRDDCLTECGKALDGVESVITGDQFLKRLRERRKQRTALLTCITCMNLAGGGTWETRPAAVLWRELRRVGADGGEPRTPQGVQLTNELRALSALVDAHRDEFDSYVGGLSGTASLAEARHRRNVRSVPKGR